MPEKGLDSLSAAIDAYEAQVSSALCLFYDNLGASSAPECQEAFQWSSYKKASQRCYSLCMEILSGISWGLYPAGAMLPSMNKMAEEKQVSVITIRRTLSLLGSIGVTKTVNGIGTYILPLGKVADNCDFTRPIVRKRLLDYVQSLQAFALTCRRITEITVSRLDDAGREQFKERLLLLRRRNRCELAPYGILELILHTAPSRPSGRYTLPCSSSCYGDMPYGICAAPRRRRTAIIFPILMPFWRIWSKPMPPALPRSWNASCILKLLSRRSSLSGLGFRRLPGFCIDYQRPALINKQTHVSFYAT